jgi:acyl carrier protein
MKIDEIYSKVTEILRDIFDDDSIDATPELTANDVDGWDSLSNIRVIMSVERAFGVKFSTADFAKLKNVGELVALLNTKIVAKQG